ncbi:MAG: hypothetical protein HY301_17280 [Verrucomicrobia bacterium]|nr:hypothetical protein [Verrucomicrobiota bacterium]
MSTSQPNRNDRPSRTPAPVDVGSRDSFWSERHEAGAAEHLRKAHKKWQCLACGECGFVEAAYGEDRLEVTRRIAHGCQPESIAFYSPGAHRPLME